MSQPEVLEIDGVRWVELKQAAKFSLTKAVCILKAIEGGSIESLKRDGKTFIHFGTAVRLKREASAMRAISRSSKLGETLPSQNRQGPLSNHRDQMPLPMDIGRKGRGWLA